jgi:triacylglycerol lipase
VTLAHLLKLFLFLELALETAIAAAVLYYFQQAWYWLVLCVPLFFIMARYILLTSEFFIAAWFGRARAQTRLSGLAWFQCITQEMLVMMSNFSLHMAVPSWFNYWAMQKHPAVSMPGKKGVIVLVHGIACNAVVWRSLRSYLIQQGWIVRALNLTPIFAPIEHYNEALRICIEDCCSEYGCDQVFVVTHSMGGLVLRSYLQQSGDKRLAHAITIATPHQGSVLAAIGLSANVRDMRQNSRFLRALDSSAYLHKITCFLSQHDNLVIPYGCAHLPGTQCVSFSGIGHVSLLFKAEVQRYVHMTLCQHVLKMNTLE